MFGIRYMRGNEEYVRLKDVQERVNKQLKEFEGRFRFVERVAREVEADKVRPKLQALIDEYEKFGGTPGFYCTAGTKILLKHQLTITWPVQLTEYNENTFQSWVLIPQKARWAESHSCPTPPTKTKQK